MSSLGAYLFDQLRQRGVRQVFGIPGDFAIPLFDALERYGALELVTLSHEPSIGFAADGAARATQGPGVAMVTYGAGGFNMLNPVGCAYTERSPLIVISGAPGVGERNGRVTVHHQVGGLDTQLEVYRRMTQTAMVLDDPATAAREINRALDTALLWSRPVYLEVPRDLAGMEIPVDVQTGPAGLPVDEEAVIEAADGIAARMNESASPILIVGIEVHRFRLIDRVVVFAESLNIPVVTSFLGRSAFPAGHPQMAGAYSGAADPAIRERVEASDCLLMLGVLATDTNIPPGSALEDPARRLLCVEHHVRIGRQRYDRVPLNRLIETLLARRRLRRRTGQPVRTMYPAQTTGPDWPDRPVRVQDIIDGVNWLFQEQGPMPVVTDTGDCLFATLEMRGPAFIAPAAYAAMGFGVPAGMGYQMGSGQRPLILVGDGGFQMTGPEIAHCRRYGLNPIVVVFHNDTWSMVQAFSPAAGYCTLPSWPYAKLAELWGGMGIEVRMARALRDALLQARRSDRFVVIDVLLQKGDRSSTLRTLTRRHT